MRLLPARDGCWFIDPDSGHVYGRPLGYRSRDGYIVIDGTWSGKGRTLQAHRLVWEAVHGSIPAGLQINHKNGDKADNRIENLELVTAGENVRHAWKIGLCRARTGEDHHGAKLTESGVREIRAIYEFGSQGPNGARALARRFGVTRETIRDVIARKVWKEVIS